MTTALLVAAGTLASVFGAHAVARDDAEKDRLAFNLSSTEIASTLRQAIRHEEDLVWSASAFVASDPHSSPAAFDGWAEAVHALQRYPELEDVGLLVAVNASQLNSFKARMLVHPILPRSRQPSGSKGTFNVVPEGKRPYYCFAEAGVVRRAVAILPPGLDYCALEPNLIQARDTGLSSYVPFTEGSMTTLGVQTPVYLGGVTPATVTARRRAFLGWLAESLVPSVLLQTALAGHPGAAVSFRYRSGMSDVVFSSGRVPPGAQSATVDLHNGWTVQSFAVMPAEGMFTDAHALILLIGGTLLSALLGLLLFLLGTGRARATALVREKTRELSHQAMHDALTGLPNRALVFDRAEHMVARCAREPSMSIAAMFIDFDGFKRINDSYGHAAGDRLLKVAGERLRGGLREEDTVGRLGGDEFVVLLESATGETQPDKVAKRLIDTLRQPVVLDDEGTVVSISASIGIALGRRASADALLRDADLALYAAKAAGKDRYMLFEASMLPPEQAAHPERDLAAAARGPWVREPSR